MAADTFALTQIATTRCSSLVDSVRLPALRKQSLSPLQSRAASTARLEAKSLLESLNTKAKLRVAKLKPGELLLKMKALEGTQGAREKLKEMEAEVMLQKRRYDWLTALSERKAQLLSSLQQELCSLCLPSHRHSGYQQLLARLGQTESALEREEHYSQVLTYMKDCRTRDLLLVRKPIAALHMQDRNFSRRRSLIALRAEHCAAAVETLKRQHSTAALKVASKQRQRRREVTETLKTINNRYEYEACREQYRYFSADFQLLQAKEQSIEQLEQAKEVASALEKVAEEVQQQDAYLTRQELSFDKLRKAAYVDKLEEVTGYYFYLKETGERLKGIKEKLIGKIARNIDEVEVLMEELKAAEQDKAQGPGSSVVALEGRLYAAQNRVKDLQTHLECKEKTIVEVNHAFIRLLSQLTPHPSPALSPLSILSQLQLALIPILN